MHIIRNTEDMAAVCNQPLDPELLSLLGAYAAALEEFGDLQATILTILAGDTLIDAEQAFGERLVAEGRFTFVVELITRHERWFDIVRIIADDGSGLVLIVEIAEGTDHELLAACEHALAEAADW